MTVEQLIEHLKTLEPTATVQYKPTVISTDSAGFMKAQPAWVELNEKNVFKTRFGGNVVFIGDN